MRLEAAEKYIARLLAESTPECPVWNVEQIRHGSKAKWNYIDGCMIKAVLDLYEITSDKKYLDFADEFISWYINGDGSIATYDKSEYNLDNINEGKVLFPLYDMTRRKKYKKAADIIYQQIKEQPRTHEGSFWHKKIYPNQVWLDGLYMAQPFYMEWEKRYNGFGHIDDVCGQFETVRRRMRDEKTGLYYHAYDASKKMFWCDRKTGLSPNFWLRALSWFAMALVDTAEIIPDNYKNKRDSLLLMLGDLFDSLMPFRDSYGMWYQLPAKPELEGNYAETSGSAILAYSMMKAARLGFVDGKFSSEGLKTFRGITERRLKDKNGVMSLGGICLVAGLGGKDMREGSDEYYLSEPVVEDDAKGVAPFLMAYTEIMRMKETGER